jgi:hypothetical protein
LVELLTEHLTEFVREMTRRRILKKSPGMPEGEVKAEMFRQFYSGEFTMETVEDICNSLRNCFIVVVNDYY